METIIKRVASRLTSQKKIIEFIIIYYYAILSHKEIVKANVPFKIIFCEFPNFITFVKVTYTDFLWNPNFVFSCSYSF